MHFLNLMPTQNILRWISLRLAVCQDSSFRSWPFQRTALLLFLKSEEFHSTSFNLAPLHWCFTIFACQGDIMCVCKIMIFQQSLSMHQPVLRTGESWEFKLTTVQDAQSRASTVDMSLLSIWFCLRYKCIPEFIFRVNTGLALLVSKRTLLITTLILSIIHFRATTTDNFH